MMGNVALAESWAPRLDDALGKFYPKDVAQSVGNYMMTTYRLFKAQEQQQKQGPGLGAMMGK